MKLLIIGGTAERARIRPGNLTNGKKRTTYKHGADTGNYILTKMISRASIAHFILSQLNDKTYLYKAPGVTN